MILLPDVLTNAILLRMNVPVEMRTIIVEDYFPFLPNEQKTESILSNNDLLNVRDISGQLAHCWSNMVIGVYMIRNIIIDNITKFRYGYCMKVEKHKEKYYINIICEMALGSRSFLYYKDRAIYEFICDQLSDISFIKTDRKRGILLFDAKNCTISNVEYVRKAILKWYRKMVYMAIFNRKYVGPF